MGSRETVVEFYIKKVTACTAEDPGQAKIQRPFNVWIWWTAGQEAKWCERTKCIV